VVRDRDGFAIAIVPMVDLDVTPVRSLDASRSVGHVRLDGITVADGRRLPISEEGLAYATAEATVAFALELVGTCQSIFDTSLQYAKERYQFGVPIGSFQAVKHKLANMFVAIERARAVALFAAATIEERDARQPMATAMAKAAAGECQKLVAQDGIQLLGGIGFTWEHDQQLFVKRAKASDAFFGTAVEHRAIVADLLGV
jgi:alkylation response protein AidB-like acyl-CoA dehydrogenase